MTTQETQLVIRATQAEDTPTIFNLILALAAYEKLTHAVSGDARQLERHLFGPRPYAEALLAEEAGRAIGLALFYPTYSTFATRPGLYLEDLFVVPERRGRGIGRALIARVARLAHERGFGRLEWSVLDWNAPAIGFYQRMGAQVLPDWRICRLTGDGLRALAGAPPNAHGD